VCAYYNFPCELRVAGKLGGVYKAGIEGYEKIVEGGVENFEDFMKAKQKQVGRGIVYRQKE